MIDYNLLANSIRMLSADSVEKANSGHPGMPMGMAEIGTILWKNHLKHNPKNPNWIDRDRFILSNGHGSMLIYSLLHLTGYDLSIEDLKQFRQLGSRTPGHPEYGYTPGVETTTGPLGQGLANAVGMALTEKLLAYEFNRADLNIVDHFTYVCVGDGCLMEGISHEVCSLAGTYQLSKLIVFYDDNGISIDGEVCNWFNESVAKRFVAYNWHVIDNIDGHDIKQIDTAIFQAKAETTKPTMIICKTQIGKGSPNKVGTEESHGSALGAAEIALTRKELNWPYQAFEIPQAAYDQFDCTASGKQSEHRWNELFAKYQAQYPDLAQEFKRRISMQLPQNFDQIIQDGVNLAINKAESIASRKASQNAIEHYAKFLPELVGGSADLTGSNLTKWSFATALTHANHFIGNYISYGVREFGMSAMLNGIYLHGGIKPFGGTFLMFSEYARNALRMASLMKIAPIFVYTHDSIGLGEDGPTHQPVEQTATLRLIPNMHVWRPCDTVETMVAWGLALQQTTTPSSLILSRQNLKFIERSAAIIENIRRGGYILRDSNLTHCDAKMHNDAANLRIDANDCNSTFEIIIIATGSEVELGLEVYEQLVSTGKSVRLVSMPSTSVFDKQEISYRNHVLPPYTKYKIAIEAGVADSWYKYVGQDGLIVSIDTFGESAKAGDLFTHFGLTIEHIMVKINNLVS